MEQRLRRAIFRIVLLSVLILSVAIIAGVSLSGRKKPADDTHMGKETTALYSRKLSNKKVAKFKDNIPE